MVQSYRTLKIEPTFRLVTADGELTLPGNTPRGQDSKRILRVESSFRVVDCDGRQAAAAKPAALVNPPEPSPSDLSEQVIRKAPDAILLIGADGRIRFANSACSTLLGYSPEELTGEPIERLVPEDARAAHVAHRAGFHTTGPARPMGRMLQLHAIHKDGRSIPVDVAVSPFDGDAVHPIYVVAVRDATGHSAVVARLEELATTDPLTGVANRRSFGAAGEREFDRFNRQGSALSVLVIDIDHFKAINDTHGHKVGDQALVLVASTCISKLRRTDLLARIGGEEFAILIPGSKTAEAMLLAERVREGISKIDLVVGDATVRFTASIGLAEAKPQDRTIAEALERADCALYEAKRRGRNQTIVAPAPHPPESSAHGLNN